MFAHGRVKLIVAKWQQRPESVVKRAMLSMIQADAESASPGAIMNAATWYAIWSLRWAVGFKWILLILASTGSATTSALFTVSMVFALAIVGLVCSRLIHEPRTI